MFDADCIVVGSGPAGVSVSLPLVEAGLKVLMIDGAGRDETIDAAPDEPWRRMLGARLEALLPEDGLSPKLRTPAARTIARDFHEATQIYGEGFVAVGARARGGLSQIWGGLVCEFDAADTADWPITIEDLRSSYKTVVERIGVSGSSIDDMADFYGRAGAIQASLPIGPSATRLFERYRSDLHGPEFAIGIARNAILTLDRDDRQACNLCNKCLWGCARGAIYNAKFDLAKLERHRTFRLVDEAFAVSLAQAQDGWEVFTADGRRFVAPCVALAAGTLSSAALALPLLPNVPSELYLLSNPVIAMPLLLPARLGWPASTRGYSLAQLGYRLRYGSAANDYTTGAVYETTELPASSVTARLPFGRRAGTVFFNAVAPAMLIATGYFSGDHSDNKLKWERQGERIRLLIRGGFDTTFRAELDGVIRRLRKMWWKLGAVMLPGTSLATPGTDVHYAGPFAMGELSSYGTTTCGELHAAPGIFIVDGAVLPTLPPKYATLTIMANADRIGRHLVRICTRKR